MVEYVKAQEDDAAVVELAGVSGLTVKEVAALLNQDRYRKAYNKRQQERNRLGRKLLREHPELVKEVKG